MVCSKVRFIMESDYLASTIDIYSLGILRAMLF